MLVFFEYPANSFVVRANLEGFYFKEKCLIFVGFLYSLLVEIFKILRILASRSDGSMTVKCPSWHHS